MLDWSIYFKRFWQYLNATLIGKKMLVSRPMLQMLESTYEEVEKEANRS